MLFTKQAKDKLHHASKGVPRIMNILAYKAMLSAFSKGEKHINRQSVKGSIAESFALINTVRSPHDKTQAIKLGVLLLLSVVFVWQLLSVLGLFSQGVM
jgi:hypothetical protein